MQDSRFLESVKLYKYAQIMNVGALRFLLTFNTVI